MFIHYLKIAIRNIRKFALQNTVSVIGLAAGFVCLSLSSVWLYYENSFDRFHKDADRIYTFNESTQDGKDILKKGTGNRLLKGITETIEPEATTYFRLETDNEHYTELQVDSAFCGFFGISTENPARPLIELYLQGKVWRGLCSYSERFGMDYLASHKNVLDNHHPIDRLDLYPEYKGLDDEAIAQRLFDKWDQEEESKKRSGRPKKSK